MAPFVTFLVIIAVIWTLSGIANAASKRREMERRRMLQLQLQRAALHQRATGGQPTPRRISQGIAARFPDVLLPPTPTPVRKAPPAPPRRAQAPQQQRRPAQAQGQRQPQRRGGKPVAAPPPPVSAPPAYVTPQIVPAVAAAAAARPGRLKQVDALTVSRWATPAILRQQFILTEIFQPPLALRDRP